MNKQNIVIFLGPPGSGKGSLSNLAIKNMGFNQISTGNLCRQHIANATDIGNQIDSIIKSGRLIPDELITSMVFDWLNQRNNGFLPIILDGYPRTVNQAIALNDFHSGIYPEQQCYSAEYAEERLQIKSTVTSTKLRAVTMCYYCMTSSILILRSGKP